MPTLLPTDNVPTMVILVALGAVTLRSRFVMAPLTQARAGPTRVSNDLMVQPTTTKRSPITWSSLRRRGWAASAFHQLPNSGLTYAHVMDKLGFGFHNQCRAHTGGHEDGAESAEACH